MKHFVPVLFDSRNEALVQRLGILLDRAWPPELVEEAHTAELWQYFESATSIVSTLRKHEDVRDCEERYRLECSLVLYLKVLATVYQPELRDWLQEYEDRAAESRQRMVKTRKELREQTEPWLRNFGGEPKARAPGTTKNNVGPENLKKVLKFLMDCFNCKRTINKQAEVIEATGLDKGRVSRAFKQLRQCWHFREDGLNLANKSPKSHPF